MTRSAASSADACTRRRTIPYCDEVNRLVALRLDVHETGRHKRANSDVGPLTADMGAGFDGLAEPPPDTLFATILRRRRGWWVMWIGSSTGVPRGKILAPT